MIKRPRGRPRKYPIATTVHRKTAADILSENNLPNKNASSQHISAIVRSVQINGIDLNQNTMASGSKKRGIIIQSETKQQTQDSEESILVASQSKTTSTITPIILYRNGIGACKKNSSQSNNKKRRVRFQLSEDEEDTQEDSESTKAGGEDKMLASLNIIEDALNTTANSSDVDEDDDNMDEDDDNIDEDDNKIVEDDGKMVKGDDKTIEDNDSRIEKSSNSVKDYINMSERRMTIEDNSNILEGNNNILKNNNNILGERLDGMKDNDNTVEDDRPVIENNESVIKESKNVMKNNDTRDGNALNEIQSNLYCSVCLSPQSIGNFLNHIKEEHKGNNALGWDGFSLPVLLPLIYAVQGEKVVDLKKATRPCIKHPDIVPNPDDPSFFCKACERTYGDKASYRIHLIRVHNMNVLPTIGFAPPAVSPTVFPDPDSPTYYCATCDKDFSNKTTFITHIKHVHYAGVHCCYNCELCSVPFGTSKLLDRHMLYKHNIKRIQYVDSPSPTNYQDTSNSNLVCSLCDEKFNSIGVYLKHADIHYFNQPATTNRKEYAIPNPADSDLFCSACQEYYSVKTTFLQHLRDAHRVEGPGFKVRPNLQKGRRSGGSADRARVDRVRRVGTKRIGRPRKRVKITDLYQPEESSSKEEEESARKGTRRQPKRVQHRRVVHPEVMPDVKDKLFYCGSCEIKLSSQNEYYDHLQSQHKYLLKELPPIASSSSSKDDPTYFCSLCHMKFDNRSVFSDHLQTAHHMELASPATNSDFTCELCQEEFRGKAHLSEHLDEEHPHASSNKKKNFICCFCNLNCFHAPGLGLHKQKTHHISFVYDDVNLYCNLCDRVSPSLERYERHLKVHKIDFKEEQNEEQSEEKHEGKEVKQVKHLLVKTEQSQVARWTTQKLETPDISDPDNKYCRVCKITYNSPVHYKLHCVKYHKIDL